MQKRESVVSPNRRTPRCASLFLVVEPIEPGDDLLVTRLRELVVPRAHGVEGLRGREADVFVHEVGELGARLARRDRHGDDDPRGREAAQ